MNRFTTLAASLLAMFVIAGCGDDAATEPSSPNGYVVNGDDYGIVDVVSSSSSALMTSTTSTISMTGTLSGLISSVSIVVNGNTAQEYTWTGNNNVYVTLTVGTGATQRIFRGNTGKTTLTSVGTSGGKAVGTFQGTLVDENDNTKRVEINGRFNANIQ